MVGPPTNDLARSWQLHFGQEAPAWTPPQARRALRSRPVPPFGARVAQRLAMKAGLLDWERAWLRPFAAAQRAVLGQGAAGPPRVLVRVDEFPYYSSFDDPGRYGLEAARRFHAAMVEHDVPYLMSIVSQLTQRPLDPAGQGGRPLGPAELEFVEELRHDGIAFAQHGTAHRTRWIKPRRHSELCGLPLAEADALVEAGRTVLAAIDVHPRVFVAPFNRFDAAQYPILARHFDVVCGGPESVGLMGFHGGPLWRGEAVYLPCYPPLYGRAREMIPALERLLEEQPGGWVPLVLHSGWEADDGFQALPRLAQLLAECAAPWSELLAAMDASSGTPLAPVGV